MVIVVIEGPANRAKDTNRLKVGLPDLFIPMHGVSPLRFRIVAVIEWGGPHDEPVRRAARASPGQASNSTRGPRHVPAPRLLREDLTSLARLAGGADALDAVATSLRDIAAQV